MSDVLDHPEAPVSPEHVAIFRKDYRPPDWLVPEVALDFDLGPERSWVRSTLKVTRNGDHDRPLRLAGNGLKPLNVGVDGDEAQWTLGLYASVASSSRERHFSARRGPAQRATDGV